MLEPAASFLRSWKLLVQKHLLALGALANAACSSVIASADLVPWY
jgi:hypothetical protein